MTATKLIGIAAAKGIGISRKRANHYRYTNSNGESVVESSFFGKFHEFAKFIQSL